MSHFMMYLITRVNYLQEFFCVMSCLHLIPLGFGLVILLTASLIKGADGELEEFVEKLKKYKVKRKIVAILMVGMIFWGAYTLTPNMKEIAAIYLVPKIASNEEMAKIPDNLARLFNNRLESYINETFKSESEDEGGK